MKMTTRVRAALWLAALPAFVLLLVLPLGCEVPEIESNDVASAPATEPAQVSAEDAEAERQVREVQARVEAEEAESNKDAEADQGQVEAEGTEAEHDAEADAEADQGQVEAEGTEADKGEEVDHLHDHEIHQRLVWIEKDIEYEGYTISVGYHGNHFHNDDGVEPAVSILRDGKPVSDAKVFNTLLDVDGKTVFDTEIDAVFEPATEKEPAHYAQGNLAIPGGKTKSLIHFRVELPGVEKDFVRELEVTSH
jgi:hypothetical protein